MVFVGEEERTGSLPTSLFFLVSTPLKHTFFAGGSMPRALRSAGLKPRFLFPSPGIKVPAAVARIVRNKNPSLFSTTVQDETVQAS